MAQSPFDILYRNYILPYRSVLFIILLLVIFIIVGYYGYKWYATPIINKKEYDDVANANRRNKDIVIYFFQTFLNAYTLLYSLVVLSFKI